jgi:ketopantoate hydroxymethyltransferase
MLDLYECPHPTMTGISKRIRAPDLALMKKRRERIVTLTAYDATMARLLDQAGVDLLPVGDSLGHVILGLGKGAAKCAPVSVGIGGELA